MTRTLFLMRDFPTIMNGIDLFYLPGLFIFYPLVLFYLAEFLYSRLEELSLIKGLLFAILGNCLSL